MTIQEGPDKYLQWMLNLLYKQMLIKDSQFYLPKLIQGQTNPAYEPYTIDGQWEIGKSQALQQGGTLICFATLPDRYDKEGYQGIASEPPDLTLASPSETVKFPEAIAFQVIGISNVTPNQPIVGDNESASATAEFSLIPDWPHSEGITIQGNYHIRQPCCASSDGETCLSGTDPYIEDGYGTFKVTFRNASAKIAGTAYTEGMYLQIRMDSLDVVVSTRPEDVTVRITIDTITDPHLKKMWESYAIEAVSDPATMNTMQEKLREKLNSPDTLGDFQKVINENLRKLLPSIARTYLAEADPDIRAAFDERSGETIPEALA